LETVAVIRLKQFPGTADSGIAISKLVVLQEGKKQWHAELTVTKRAVRNPAGYVGMDFIDDLPQSTRDLAGFYVWYWDYVDTEGKKPGFALTFQALRWDMDEEQEGPSWEIAWNPTVGRFQEYTENEDPPGFRPEKKNLPRVSEWLKLHGCGDAAKSPCGK
jgi:hypothetical protein